nr:B3 domain-containing protein REM5-like isoform X2 [Ipomoea batatas]
MCSDRWADFRIANKLSKGYVCVTEDFGDDSHRRRKGVVQEGGRSSAASSPKFRIAAVPSFSPAGNPYVFWLMISEDWKKLVGHGGNQETKSVNI